MTFAIHGFNDITVESLSAAAASLNENLGNEVAKTANESTFTIFPNPTTRTVFMNENTDVALYDMTGKRIMVKRNTTELDVSNLTPGSYFIQNAEGETLKLIVK